MGDRGQLSVTLLEAGIGAILVLSVAALVVFAGGATDTGVGAAQLDRYAHDLGRVLMTPSGGEATLSTLLASPSSFQAVDDTLTREATRALPAGVFFRVETAYGSLGYPRPDDTVMGTAQAHTVNGTVRIWVWTA